MHRIPNVSKVKDWHSGLSIPTEAGRLCLIPGEVKILENNDYSLSSLLHECNKRFMYCVVIDWPPMQHSL